MKLQPMGVSKTGRGAGVGDCVVKELGDHVLNATIVKVSAY